MATRMQQRRGTAAQWTSADPILAAGEIGFETDTGEFRVGDGSNHWSDLSPFKNIVDLGGNLDDYVPLTSVGDADGVASLDSTGNVPATQLVNVLGTPNVDFNTLQKIEFEMLNSAGANHAKINEIADTLITAAVGEQATAQNEALGSAINQEVSDRNIAISTAVDTAVGTHTSDTTNVHGIADTTALATKTYADDAVSAHSSDTTNVHGISDTADLATKAGIETLTNKTISAADNTVTVNLADVIDVTASASEVNILDGATLTVTELNYVDGVTSSIQTQLDAKAPTANPTFTGTVNASTVSISGNLTVGGTTTTANTASFTVTDPLVYFGEGNNANIVDLGFVASYNDGAYHHAGLARDASDNKWKLFSSVEDEPTTTINFAQAEYDTLVLGAVEFPDGVQVKQGVPSLTAINQQSGAYTTVLADRDKLVEVSSASGVTVTIPANSSVAYPVGTSIDILQTGAGQITIAGAGGVTVNATPGLKLRTQWSSATLFKRATDTWVVFGDLSA